MTRLKDKVVIVTGAGSGLGFEYALAAARQGARVVVNDVDGRSAAAAVARITAEGGEAITAVGSVASWEVARALIDTTTARFGVLDGIVLNAAIMHMAEPWAEDELRLRAIADVNILGVQFPAVHAMRAMVAAGSGGSVLTVVSGAMLGIRGMSAYGASKGAVAAMTRNWAIEGEPHGIRVNAISPAALTRMTTDHLERVGQAASAFRSPATIAPAVVALLSDEMVGLTGRMIRFDGITLSEYVHTTSVLGEITAWSADDITNVLRDLPSGLPTTSKREVRVHGH